ncbi:uncharacterized protein MYCFIDRAFT_30822 [Pseudocercospora fijiensis CIRAD86]|uniref:Uncharacterized protein n=1 Tax=Pseudocercospora fijiensis (strain CIRAD86) TaxID=383855 RepID=M3A782_PSEFD|nr:uncharacterized protein MYCFIDRAFT_30822 [Pseudocercospora fijiensis CIRAD86]EME80481.1 hypothetical protein MYCFIDRAFT_30822 [Pseudocercospora fijiensis CIRAD86]
MKFVLFVAKWLGLVAIVRWIFTLVDVVVTRLLIRSSKLQDYHREGEACWALVTGSSDGIGYGFAQELLSRGFNVLLHGRNGMKLLSCSKDLQSQYPHRQIQYVVSDSSRSDGSYLLVARRAESLPGKLTVLINNIGGQTLTPQFAPHWSLPHTDIDATMNMNMRFAAHLTKALFPLLRHSHLGISLNCGSTGGLLGVPYLATYTASKAFVHTFTEALKTELLAEKVNNVETMGFVIGNTDSNTNKEKIPFLTVTSRECAKACLDRIGCGRTLVVPHWKHMLQVWIGDCMPEAMKRKVMGDEMRARMERERKIG